MNAYSSNSPNPYAKRYLTKGRRSLDRNKCLDAWPTTKRFKKELQHNEPDSIINRDQINVINQKSETYNFLAEDNDIQNELHEFYDEVIEYDRIQEPSVDSYIPLDENDNHNGVDENNIFYDGSHEEYSIDYIDDTDNHLMDSFNYTQYQDLPAFSSCLLESQFVSQPMKSKRKQGIVGRPTLSSPQRLMVPDNVYSRGNPCVSESENCFSDNNYRKPAAMTVSRSANYVIKKPLRQDSLDYDDSTQKNTSRKCPRILSKPAMLDSRHNIMLANCFNATEQDALEIAQRTVANREFARNLVKRAERQGTVIDKNKIPLSVFEQQPVEVLLKSALDEQLAGIAEIKESETMITRPFSITDVRKPPVLVKSECSVPTSKPAQITASDILKQKWKAANRQQS